MYNIEKNISQFIDMQFPAFYKEDGPIFIEFIKYYFEWLEEQNEITFKTRRLLDYRDIDATLDEYINHFKDKYLKNIPFNIQGDKRLLIKHIIDLYRAKGSERGHELLMRTLYNKEIEIYYPGDDMLRVSDGEWYEGKYIEVSSFVNIEQYIENRIIGLSSGAEATVERYSQKISNSKVVDVLELSNVKGNFDYGENIYFADMTPAGVILPRTTGSLTGVSIINGGSNFSVGNILDVEGKGFSGKAKVTSTTTETGKVNFRLIDGGTGYSINAISQVYPKLILTTINNTGLITNNQLIYVTNVLGVITSNGIVMDSNSSTVTLKEYISGYTVGDTVKTAIKIIAQPYNAVFQNGERIYQRNGGADTANGNIVAIESNVGNTIYYVGNITGSFTTSVFGTSNTFTINGQTSGANGFVYEIYGGNTSGSAIITNIYGGGSGASFSVGDITNKEIVTINTDYVRGYINSKLTLFNTACTGTVSTVSGCNVVTGIGTTFTSTLAPSKYVQINTLASASNEIRQVLAVTNNISFTTTAVFSITQSGKSYFVDTIDYNFLPNGIENLSTILQNALTYEQKEIGTIRYLSKINPGIGYSLNPYVYAIEPLIASLQISSLNGYKGADAIIEADARTSVGIVSGISIIDSGYGYEPAESLVLTSPDLPFAVSGAAIVNSNGRRAGYWKSTRGFLDSDKYIQDSKYYQEYSYEIQTGLDFNTYKNVIKTLLHPAGIELFGKFVQVDEEINNDVEYVESSVSSS